MKDFLRMMLLAPDKGADGEGIDVDLEFEEEDGIELELDDDDEDIDLGEDEKPEDKPEPEKPKEKMVSLKALEAERAKWKKRLAALESNQQPVKPDTADASVDKQKFIDAGFDESVAEMLTKALGTATGKANSVEKLVGKKFRDQEFKEFSKEYPEVDRDEIEEYADRKGLSLEEAYFAKFGRDKIKTNRADLRREIEQQVRDEYRKKGSMKFDTDNNGETTKGQKSKLSSDELQIAKMSGMTPQEYFIMKHAKSFDGMSKAKKK
jgi:hypothetical protein